MKKTVIHVNQHNIRKNKSEGTNLPVFTAKDYKQNRIGNGIRVKHPGTGEVLMELVYKPKNPLKCGAHAWLETQMEVEVF